MTWFGAIKDSIYPRTSVCSRNNSDRYKKETFVKKIIHLLLSSSFLICSSWCFLVTASTIVSISTGGQTPCEHLLHNIAQPVVIDSLLKHPRRIRRQHRTGHDAAARRVLASGGSNNGHHQDIQDDRA